jgi:hypothetical protein
MYSYTPTIYIYIDVFDTLRQLVRIKNGGVTVKKKI